MTDNLNPIQIDDTTALKDLANAIGNRFCEAGEALMKAQTEYYEAYQAWFDVNTKMKDAGFSEDEVMDLTRGILIRAGHTEAEVDEMVEAIEGYFAQVRAAEDEYRRAML